MLVVIGVKSAGESFRFRPLRFLASLNRSLFTSKVRVLKIGVTIPIHRDTRHEAESFAVILYSPFLTLHVNGASGRTRTDEYKFTKLAL